MDEKEKNFFAYMNRLLSRESIMLMYESNNIKYDKCELYCDYVLSLLHLIYDTYLGDDITDEENRKKHFEWCWKKNVENFSKEGINIDGKKIYDYFFEYFFIVFYMNEEKDDEKNKIMDFKLWKDVFDYVKPKTHSDVDAFVEVYTIFEESRKNV